MAAMTITEIIRQTLDSDKVSAADLTDTYIPVAEAIFENITGESLTVATDTTGTLHKDMALAYFAICAYYTVKKEGHMVGSRDDQIPAHVWWEQTAFHYMCAVGYSEFFNYDNVRGLYIVKGKQPRVADIMAVKVMTGDGDVI